MIWTVSWRLPRLPHGFLCYRPNSGAPDVVSPPCLSAGFVTFGSFNNPAKINADIVALWARVLQCVPNSKLLLKYGGLQDKTVQDRISGWFASSGIDRKRLDFMGKSESATEHLGLYGRVDIALDTHPYNGATTSCEALWMGVPVVSMAGDRHVSCIGTSLLNQIDLPELTARDPDEYAAIARDLAGDRDRLVQLRDGLRDRLRASTLMDEAGFARRLEAAFHQMLQLRFPALVAQ